MRRLVWPAFLLLAACEKNEPSQVALTDVAPVESEDSLKQVPKINPCLPVRKTPVLHASPQHETGSTLALVETGGHTIAIAADEDDQSLVFLDVDTKTPLGKTELAGMPSKVLVAPDGRVFVALADKSAIEVLEPETDKPLPLARRCLVDVPAEPVAMAKTPDGQSLLVVSRWGHALSSLDMQDLSAKQMVELPRDPTAVLASSDGKRAFVTHAAAGVLSVVDLDEEKPGLRTSTLGATHSTEIRFPMKKMKSRPKEVPSSKGRFSRTSIRHSRVGTQAFSLVRAEGGKIFAPFVLTEPKPPPGVATGYGSADSFSPPAAGDVAVLNETTEAITSSNTRESAGLSDCILPRAAAMNEATKELWVTCLGIQAAIAYDATKKHPRLHETRRFKVPAGPTGIAIEPKGKMAVVFSQYEGAFTLLSLEEKQSKNASNMVSIVLTDRKALPADLALGRALFHAAGKRRVAFDGRACASCHPDGRDDGLTWNTQEGPRQTPILLGRLNDSAPFGWLGDKKDLPSHFERTLARLRGTGLNATEREAIFAWVRSLKPPRETPKSDDTMLALGKTIFESEETACASCHQGSASTDGDRHDVASKTTTETTANFETPSLRFIARSAPYFHDGRYATILDMLKGIDGTMGKTSHLKEDELVALATYVESL